MTDISEAQTFEYFMQGAAKAKSAVRELAKLKSSKSWVSVRSALGQIERNGQKLFNARPQTEMDNLVLASRIEKTH